MILLLRCILREYKVKVEIKELRKVHSSKERSEKKRSSEKDPGYESSKHHEIAKCSGLQSSEKKVLERTDLFLILIYDFVVKMNLKRI